MHSYFRFVQKDFSCNYISSGIQIRIKISKNVSYVGTMVNGSSCALFSFCLFPEKISNSNVLKSAPD